MELKYTKHQTARGARFDAETHDKIYLFKSPSKLRATYQIRLLLFMAIKKGKKLEIQTPKSTKASRCLGELRLEANGNLIIKRV